MKVSGDAVTPVDGDKGELLFRGCDFGDGVTEVSARVAGEGVVELSLNGGETSAVLTLGTPTGPYDYTVVDASFTASGVHDVRIALRGPQRLAHLGFSGEGLCPPRPGARRLAGADTGSLVFDVAGHSTC
jgi:beta-glucosidase